MKNFMSSTSRYEIAECGMRIKKSRQEAACSRQQTVRSNKDRFVLSEAINLRGLNKNKEGGGLIIGDRLKAWWGVLEDKNELAYSWQQGLHIVPDLSGYLAKRGLLAIYTYSPERFSLCTLWARASGASGW